MPEFKPTPGQALAINDRGGETLVSAAAGSGKTRVLIERLMSYILDAEHPVDVDSFLIITFTRAAAAYLDVFAPRGTISSVWPVRRHAP